MNVTRMSSRKYFRGVSEDGFMRIAGQNQPERGRELLVHRHMDRKGPRTFFST